MNEIIVSKNNSKIIATNKLKDKKYRYLNSQYLIEGVKLVGEAISSGQKIEQIFVTQQLFDKYCQDYSAACDEVYIVSDEVAACLSDTITPQGVVSVINFNHTIDKPQYERVLLLENLQDIGNVGTILRTAIATNYYDIYLVNCADVYSPKCIRAGMSAQFRLNINVCNSIDDAMQAIGSGYQYVCCDMDGKSIFDKECHINQCHALLFGNEGQGITDKLKQNSDTTISLPMLNNLESLNVSVSASVIMYVIAFNKGVK